jgi:hypothetical protein
MELTSPAIPASKLRVFLSYRSVEARFADVLKRHLVEDFIGLVQIFLASDTTSIPAGTHWLAEIVGGLRTSQLHIVICSKYSVYRPWINYEAGAAGVRGIPIIPLCHSGLVPAQLAVPLSESEGGIITHADALQKLYARVAGLIGSSVPLADFESYAAEFQNIEKQSEALLSAENSSFDGSSDINRLQHELIKDPNVLCVTSEQFRELGYENQLEIVLEAFPKNLRHQVVISSTELQRILLEERVEIIHIAAFVCPRGGDLYFSPVKLPLGKPLGDQIDFIEAAPLVALLQRAKTRLVVLGGSASLVLAAELLPVTNVIAACDMVSARAMANWVETFYRNLAKESLAAASELASQVSQAPMKLYAQQRYAPAVTVRLSQAE